MTHKAAEPQVIGVELSLVQLTERNIPGAALEEPLEGHTVPDCDGGSSAMVFRHLTRGKSQSTSKGNC